MVTIPDRRAPADAAWLLGTLGPALARHLGRVVRALAARQQRARERTALLGMDERRLTDIGLSRVQARFIAHGAAAPGVIPQRWPAAGTNKGRCV